MKTSFPLFFLLLISNGPVCAQNPNIGRVDLVPVSTVSNEDLFKYKTTFYYENEVYIVDGIKVRGTPFLYHDWAPGIIIGVDGKIFTDYQLKYNAFNQTVLFQQGKDSLEVTNLIKEFTLSVKYGDSVENFRFVNANEYKKEKTTFYYEVLSENDFGQFLRYDRKLINDFNKNMPIYEGQKFFDLEYSYYYYDKINKKITRVKAGGGNIEELLGKEAIARSGLSLKDYNFSSEQDMRNFFTQFFNSQKKKAF